MGENRNKMAQIHSQALSSDISRRNPQDEYELIQRIGSGTYGDVYKVGGKIWNEKKMKFRFGMKGNE